MPLLRITRLPDLHPGQQKVRDDPARFRMVRAGRRFGKTKLGVRECLEVGLAGGRAWWVAPSYRLTKAGWRDLHRLATQIPGVVANRSALSVELPGGGEVVARTAANPDDLRSEGLDFVVLDEAAFMKPEAWQEALRPALADRKGRALFISTPAGMVNWLADLWREAEGNPEWGLHHYSSYDNPYLDPAELDQLRNDLGDLLFRQEILAEFVELSGSIFHREWFTYYRPISVLGQDGSERVLYRLPDDTVVPYEDCSRWVTVDPAISTKDGADYTVMTAIAQTPDGRWLLEEVVRARLEAPDIVPAAAQLLTKWGGAWVGFEAVAYQTALVQYARRAGLPARPLRADRDKVTRALPLAAHLEGGRVLFRAEAGWLDELERELLLFPNGAHDDQVDALAYGVAGGVQQRRAWAAY